MKSIDVRTATGTLQQYIRDLTSEPVVLTEGDHPIAVLMSVDDDDLDRLALSSNPRFRKMIEESLENRRKQGALTSDEVRHALGLPQRSTGK